MSPEKHKTSVLLRAKHRDFLKRSSELSGVSVGEVVNHAIDQFQELITAPEEADNLTAWARLYRAHYKKKRPPAE